MVKALTENQLRTAAEIDTEVVRLLKVDGDEALLQGMLPLMEKFKPLLDGAAEGQLDLLCQRYPGFGHFAQLLEAMSSAIADGKMNDILGR